MIEAESIYIHIPFCKSKCPYCDFASWANKEHLIEKYFNALTTEVKSKCNAYYNNRNKKQGARNTNSRNLETSEPQNIGTINTIFVGGGTPSLIHPKYYERLFNELKNFFKLGKNCEVTLELNPGTAQLDYLKGCKELGFNRVSIGAQSFDSNILVTLGRNHTIKETEEAISLTKEAGFKNFNLDLIYSVPGINLDIWEETIEKALSFKPNHISAYSLIIEPGTPFENIYKDKNKLPSDDFAFESYKILCSRLKDAGFIHYEISNFAKPGFESKHNLTYWNAKEYFAFGNSAHKFLNGLRSSNLKELEAYINHPNVEKIEDFPINYNFEKLMLNSRLNKGLDMHLIKKSSSKKSEELTLLFKELSKKGLLEIKDGNICFTEKGMFLNNEILLSIM